MMLSIFAGMVAGAILLLLGIALGWGMAMEIFKASTKQEVVFLTDEKDENKN